MFAVNETFKQNQNLIFAVGNRRQVFIYNIAIITCLFAIVSATVPFVITPCPWQLAIGSSLSSKLIISLINFSFCLFTWPTFSSMVLVPLAFLEALINYSHKFSKCALDCDLTETRVEINQFYWTHTRFQIFRILNIEISVIADKLFTTMFLLGAILAVTGLANPPVYFAGKCYF